MHGYLVISHAKSSKVETWIKLHFYPKRPKNRKGWNLNGCIPCVGEYWTTLGNESTGKNAVSFGRGECLFVLLLLCFFFSAKTLSHSLLLNF